MVVAAPPGPRTEDDLEEQLSRPTTGVGEALAALGGDLVFLGAGGKIGPTMARMAARALAEVGSSSKVIAVSRYREEGVRERLESYGVATASVDLSEPQAYGDLPEAAGVFYLAAMKFGTTGAEHETWWSNAAIPALVASRYRGIPTLVYSTGNVYPLTPLHHGGSKENDPTGPVGEYAQSCLARERMFTYAAKTWGTPATIFRLNYACELRYGVLVDLAHTILAGNPVDITMPAANVVWQGDSSAWALRSIELASNDPTIVNATGPEIVSVRAAATELGRLLGREVTFTGAEAPDALLSDSSVLHAAYGYPTVPVRTLMAWVAEWVGSGGRQLAKATKFQRRDGAY